MPPDISTHVFCEADDLSMACITGAVVDFHFSTRRSECAASELHFRPQSSVTNNSLRISIDFLVATPFRLHLIPNKSKAIKTFLLPFRPMILVRLESPKIARFLEKQFPGDNCNDDGDSRAIKAVPLHRPSIVTERLHKHFYISPPAHQSFQSSYK